MQTTYTIDGQTRTVSNDDLMKTAKKRAIPHLLLLGSSPFPSVTSVGQLNSKETWQSAKYFGGTQSNKVRPAQFELTKRAITKQSYRDSQQWLFSKRTFAADGRISAARPLAILLTVSHCRHFTSIIKNGKV